MLIMDVSLWKPCLASIYGCRNSDSGQMVIGAHMELASPSIKEAVKMCVEAGYSKITVAPYFLSNGRHIQEDIPALVDEAQSQFQDISCTIADPIGKAWDTDRTLNRTEASNSYKIFLRYNYKKYSLFGSKSQISLHLFGNTLPCICPIVHLKFWRSHHLRNFESKKSSCSDVFVHGRYPGWSYW